MSDLEVFSKYQGEDDFHDNGKDVHGDDDDDYGCDPTRALYSAGLFSRHNLHQPYNYILELYQLYYYKRLRHNLHQPYITFGGSPA